MVKVISLSDAAYFLLKRHKEQDMSFSDVILSRFEAGNAAKTDGTYELVAWLKARRKGGRKTRLHSQIDDVVYGVRK